MAAAMGRKAALREGSAPGSAKRAQLGEGLHLDVDSFARKIRKNSAKCGIRLADADMSSFLDFLRLSSLGV